MSHPRIAALLFGALSTALPAAAQQQPSHEVTAPAARAVRATGPIVIDGALDDAAWAGAPVVEAFTQVDPEEGQPVSRPTRVRIVYDAEALYVGARLDGPVHYRLGRRDMRLLDSDWFGVALDSYHDHRTGFRFQVNPGGVQRDATLTMAGGHFKDDESWDPVWDVATDIDDAGWSVEMRIPFSQLRFSSAPEQTWGLQLERMIGPRGEYALFAFTPKDEAGGIPRYGHLGGLTGVEPGKRLELLPYIVARGEYVDPGANPFRDSREHAISGGADLLYRVTSDLTLNATINPDFGQVEVDPAIVNLGVYETFFPEKRPFFVEGSEIFRFTGNTSGGDLFYSRRIGRQPQIGPGTTQADVPESTNILGAAKLSGKTRAGWSLGFLDAVTGEEEARYVDGQGDVARLTVEPLTNYFVGRARRDANAARTSIGGIVTAVNRNLDTPLAESTLRSDAYGGGVDFRHEWADRSWALSGSAAGSHVRGSIDAMVRTQRQSNHFFQRPDADHLDVDSVRSLSGYSVGLELSKQAGAWTGEIAGALTSPTFEVNDIGFQTRTDRRDLSASLGYSQRQPGDLLRNWTVSSFARNEQNYDGDRILRFLGFVAFARHLDFWSIHAFVNHRFRALDDRSTRGGPLMLRPRETSYALDFGSDPRKSITFSLGGSVQDGELGNQSWDVSGDVAWRTSSRWSLSVGPYFGRGTIAAQYVGTEVDPAAQATYGRRYLFAPLEFTHLNANIRFDIAFLPELTLETYLQPLIFSSDYGDVGALVAPRGYSFAPVDSNRPSRDNTFRSLRGNAVLRWEWRPGSTLYLAWQQARVGFTSDGDFALDRDPRALFEAAPDNIVVLKVSYWINP